MNERDIFVIVIVVTVVLFFLLGALAAALLGVIAAPAFVIAWLNTLFGATPKVFWYISRMSGLVAYFLVWLSVVLGLSVTNKLARLWPGGPAVVDLHQFTSLLALSFVAVHVAVLLGDQYIGYNLTQLLVPFASAEYRPFWVGLGQLAAYLAIPVSFTFYIRQRIGYRTWRTIHYGTFVLYVLVTIHSLMSGTDTQNPLMLLMYGVTSLTVLGMLIYRVRVASLSPRRAA